MLSAVAAVVNDEGVAATRPPTSSFDGVLYGVVDPPKFVGVPSAILDKPTTPPLPQADVPPAAPMQPLAGPGVD